MKTLVELALHGVIGVGLTLLSSFVGERSAIAVYPDIMGCEDGCEVVATGWPLVFVQDYVGISVVGAASISEVWFAGDRLLGAPFLFDVAFWSGLSFLVLRLVFRRTRRS